MGQTAPIKYNILWPSRKKPGLGLAKVKRTGLCLTDAADHRKGTATGETVRLCLMPADDNRHRKNSETKS